MVFLFLWSFFFLEWWLVLELIFVGFYLVLVRLIGSLDFGLFGEKKEKVKICY